MSALWEGHESRVLVAFLFYGAPSHTAGMTRVCCQANILDFTRIVVPAFLRPNAERL